jgi:hypothetical protein
MPPKSTPDHADADVILRLYDLRREPVMREAREKIRREFQPKSWGDVEAVLRPDHPLNTAYRMVSTYWEMAASFVRHGIVHPEVFGENCGEGLFLYAKMRPFVAKLRETAPFAFRNIEEVVERSAEARRRLEVFQARLAARSV